MKITVSKEVFGKFNKQFLVGFLLFEEINNKKNVEQSRHLVQEMEKLIRLTHNKETLQTHHLLAPWIVAQLEFGQKAIHYQTAVQQLIRTVLQRKSVVTKDTLTNLLRYISLKHIVPTGVDDATKIKGDLTFALGSGTESVGMMKLLKKGALYYHDEENILGTKLDFWKNKRTTLNSRSKAALVHLEALPPISTQKLKETMDELARLGKAFCGGSVKMVVLDKKQNSKIL